VYKSSGNTDAAGLVAVSDCVVCGTQAGVKHVRASQGWHMYTAFIEPLNLAIRRHMAAVGRRIMTPYNSEEGVRQQLALYQTYDNWCFPHASSRLPLPQPQGW
jgi:hypothetical protein